MDNGTYNGYNPYAFYTNYWRRTLVHGDVASREISSKPKHNYQRETKWFMAVISVTLVMVAITLVLSIYNVISDLSVTRSSKENINLIKTITTTTTTAPSQKTTATRKKTITPSQTITASSQTTTAPSQKTTALSEITEAPSQVATAPGRMSLGHFLPYRTANGDTAEDYDAHYRYSVNIPHKLYGKKYTSGSNVEMNGQLGVIVVGGYRYIQVATLEYAKCLDGYKCLFHRQVESDEDKAALSCLLNGTTILDAYVFTWVNVTDSGNNFATFQCILVYAEDLNVFVIRVYDENLVNLATAKFGYQFSPNRNYNADTASELVNERLINNISEKPEGDRFEDLSGNPNCGW